MTHKNSLNMMVKIQFHIFKCLLFFILIILSLKIAKLTQLFQTTPLLFININYYFLNKLEFYKYTKKITFAG